MSTLLSRDNPGYHDIDVPLTSGQLEALPKSLLRHWAFQPHMWEPGDHVAITTTDKRKHHGVVVTTPSPSGSVIIRVQP